MTHGSDSQGVAFNAPDDFRPRQYASVWRLPPVDWREQLAAAVEKGLGNHSPSVFFRADDIGAGGRAFETLCRLFRHHGVPLGMAVVPAWLSDIRKKQLFEAAPLEEPLWGWHQHGWRHVNWQRSGKNSEFGEHRPHDKQLRDISQGRKKMAEIFGERFTPIFTPPWNRLSTATLRILQELDFKGVSIVKPLPRGLKPAVTLKTLRIHLDLHTRKAKDGAADFQTLLAELSSLLGKNDMAGIMIHHHRMNHFSFEFLHELLNILKIQPRVQLPGFSDLLDKKDVE